MIHSWPSWVLAAAAAIAASRIASGGFGLLFDGFFSSSASSTTQHRRIQGLAPLGPLAASFLLVVLGIGIGAALVVAGLVRWCFFVEKVAVFFGSESFF